MRLGITEELGNGNPVVLHVYGRWEGANGVYHQDPVNPHFMVIYSADSQGVKVADPAGTANNITIPWEELYSQVGPDGPKGADGGTLTGIRTIRPNWK